MRFRLVENTLTESKNTKAKNIVLQHIQQHPKLKNQNITFPPNSVMHHIQRGNYETPQQLAQGIVNECIIIPNLDENSQFAATIHKMIENYSGKNIFQLFKFLFKLMTSKVVYYKNSQDIVYSSLWKLL